MKRLYKNQKRFIGRHRCVSIDEYDKCLSGKRGEIWEDVPGSTCKALYLTKDKNEKIITFPFKDLQKWVTRLQIPPSPEQQLLWANNPNRRLLSK